MPQLKVHHLLLNTFRCKHQQPIDPLKHLENVAHRGPG